MKAAALGRRGFLRVLGLAPIAGKAAADKLIAEHAGLAHGALDGLGGQNNGISSACVEAPSGAYPYAQLTAGEKAKRLFGLLKKAGLPSWEHEKIIRENRNVYTLDPDLAALRSFSMNVKIVTQRQRNIEREIARLRFQSTYQAHVEKFRRQHGYWLWW